MAADKPETEAGTVASRPAAWDADAAEMAAREEGARVAAIPNDNPTVSPGVWGDEIGGGLPEADVYPPSTIHPPRYGDMYEGLRNFDWDTTPEHLTAAQITGEFQAGHRYPHGGTVHDGSREHRARLATGTTARQAESFEDARKRDRELQREEEAEERRGAHEKADDKPAAKS